MKKNISTMCWLFLAFSILGEVFGTSIMKISHSWAFDYASFVGLIIMWLCLGFSYFCLAKATVDIPVGVAFALWDALGLILIVGFSIVFLAEEMSLQKGLGLLCVFTGGLLVHHGTSQGEENV